VFCYGVLELQKNYHTMKLSIQGLIPELSHPRRSSASLIILAAWPPRPLVPSHSSLSARKEQRDRAGKGKRKRKRKRKAQQETGKQEKKKNRSRNPQIAVIRSTQARNRYNPFPPITDIVQIGRRLVFCLSKPRGPEKKRKNPPPPLETLASLPWDTRSFVHRDV